MNDINLTLVLLYHYGLRYPAVYSIKTYNVKPV